MTSDRFDRRVRQLATRLFGVPEPPTPIVTMLAMEDRALHPEPPRRTSPRDEARDREIELCQRLVKATGTHAFRVSSRVDC